ncbi:MAG: HD domain-containing protein [Oligoflexia bacterium]|nr:HD domain-containing protein [Oligoflexia bacterium]
MSQKIEDSSEFIKISIEIIRQIQDVVPFDVYIERSDGIFTKLFHKRHPIDHEMLRRYHKEKNVANLYVHTGEHKTYRYCVEKILDSALSDIKKLSPEKLTETISEMANLTITEIYLTTEINKKVMEWAGKSITGCITLLGQNPRALLRVIEALKTHQNMLKHSMMTCIFSMLLIKKVGYDSERTLMMLGLGALLHDIGMAMLPFEWEFKPDMTVEQWKQIKEHPQLGYRMLESITSVKQEVRTIVLQHHEQPNGMGYPSNRYGGDIYYLSKVVSIADCFCDKILRHEEDEQSMSLLEALASMREEVGRFDDQLFQHFQKLFGHFKRTKNEEEDIADTATKETDKKNNIDKKDTAA